MKTCITYHEKFKQYDLGVDHPYRGDRFVKAKELFDEKGLFQSPNVSIIKPKPIVRDSLMKVHPEEYVDLIFRLAEMEKPYDLDTPVSQRILEGLMHIIGGVSEAGKAIFEGNANRAVCLGGGFHHAGRDYGGGFCLFNDIAILVEQLRQDYGLGRILILDYDVHSGNGTSDIYYSNSETLFISLHQNPRTIYPGKGFVHEIGNKKGEGFNVNVPLPMRTGERSYLYALKEIFPPIAREFRPDLIVANGGSDAHFADHLGSLGLTSMGFFEISRMIGEISEKVCDGKNMLLIGSGYNITVLPFCWYALAAGIVDIENIVDTIEDYYPAPRDPWQNRGQVEEILKDLKGTLRSYWSCF